MKVVHLSTFDIRGGAAIAAERLVRALIDDGVDASLLVLQREGKSTCVHALEQATPLRARVQFYREIWASFRRNGLKRDSTLFARSYPIAGFNVTNSPLVQEADIIHLHWINQGFLSIRSLEDLVALRKPIVWTMHDMWPVTAVAHHCKDVNAWTQKSPQSLEYRIGQRKQRLYRELKPCFVGCSEWIAREAAKSILAKECRVTHIVNAADTEHFQLVDQKQARQKLGLPEAGPIILFGAANAQDPRKGYAQLIETFHFLRHSKEQLPYAVVFGKADERVLRNDLEGFDLRVAGYVKDPVEMNLYYAAADLFLTPSLEENLPNTIIEAQLAGTPTVAFAVGGIPEIIDLPEAGKTVPLFDCRALADAVAEVLSQRDSLCRTQLYKHALERYSAGGVADSYRRLYDSLLHAKA